jgi:hypothetical protein
VVADAAAVGARGVARVTVFLLGLLIGLTGGYVIAWVLVHRELNSTRRELEVAAWRVAQTTALVKIEKAALPPDLRRIK